MATMRTRPKVLLCQVESTPGVDPGSWNAATQAILAENIQVTPRANLIQTNEHSASLDGFGSIVGGTAMTLTFRCNLKGSGTPATPPEIGKLLKGCGWAETITASAVPASAQAATAGSVNSATGGAGFTATAQLYRGMPLNLAVNPAGGARPYIADYTAGKVFSLTHLFGSTLDTSTTLQIPANVLYSPASLSLPSLAFQVFEDGKRKTLLGGAGSMSLSVQAGGAGMIDFTFQCMFSEESDQSLPTPTVQATRPPPWKASVMLMNRKAVPLQTFSLADGISPVNPDNPNALEGFDPAVITSRNLTGAINPLARSVAQEDVMTIFRQGTKHILLAEVGSSAGNRVGITVPSALYTDRRPEDRNGLAAEGLPFEATGPDAGAFLCFS